VDYLELVTQFFEIYSEYDWQVPISLFPPHTGFRIEPSIMTIFTPSILPRNTSTKVSRSTLTIITTRLKQELDKEHPFQDIDDTSLFPLSTAEYSSYIRIMASTKDQDCDASYLWMTHVRSKVNKLRDDLESLGLIIHPRNACDQVHFKVDTEENAKLLGEQMIRAADIIPGDINLSCYVFYLGVVNDGDDISKEINAFLEQCETFQAYDENHHLISANILEEVDLDQL